MFGGITILVNIIILVASLAILIFLLPNLKILSYTILNTFDFKARYIKGEFLTFSFLISLIWVVIFSFYNNYIISYSLYNQLFEFWWVALSTIFLFIVSMTVRFFKNSTPEIKDANKALKLNIKPLYFSLIIVLLAIFMYLFDFLRGADSYWSSSLPIFYVLLIFDTVLLLWLFIKIFKSNNEESK